MPDKKIITGDEPAYGLRKVAAYETTEFTGITIKQFFAAAALTGYNSNEMLNPSASLMIDEMRIVRAKNCIDDANALINVLNEEKTVHVDKTKLDYLNDQADRLNEGRDYLMQVEPSELTIEKVFKAFGFNSNGFDQPR